MSWLPLALWCALLADRAPAPGDAVEPFVLTDIRWLPRDLDDLGAARAYVFVFTTLECPIARRYVPRIVELERAYRERGAVFALVNVGAADSMVAVAAQMVEQGIAFPVFKDYDGQAVRALGVTRTPEAVVLDADRRLRYRGRIDEQYRLGGVRPDAGREHLREAIEAVLEGTPVRKAITPVEGCAITLEGDPDLPGITWADHVAPIVHRHCIECHRPRGEAPFSLRIYEDAAPRADMIAEVVRQQRMPPWFASDEHGEFGNRRGLQPGERRIVRAWVAAGAPPGDLTDAPEPPPLPRGEWEIGEPDQVVAQLGATQIPATGTVPYQYVLLPYVFLNDTWVQAIEIHCDQEPNLHHANLAYLKVGEKYRPDNFLTGKVPGGDPMLLDPGDAVMIPAGSVLGLQAHFVTTGEPAAARLSVGLRYPKDPVRRRLHHKQIHNSRFEIPPGAPAHEVRAAWTADQPIIALGMFAHMHLRGRDMTFTASYPDGSTETLLMVPNYSFDWQQSYRFPGTGRSFPKGTRIDVVAHFDNSTFNPYNPDPQAAVRFGLQTEEEMMYGFFFYFIIQ